MTLLFCARLPHALSSKSNRSFLRSVIARTLQYAVRLRCISSNNPNNCTYHQALRQTSLLSLQTPEVAVEAELTQLTSCGTLSRYLSEELSLRNHAKSLSPHPLSITHSHLYRPRSRYQAFFVGYKVPIIPLYLDRSYGTLRPNTPHIIHATPITRPNMARKLSSSASNSSLSPVADDVIAQAESKVNVKTATTGRKRKADTTDVEVTKHTRKTIAANVKTEDGTAGADESPRPKRRMAKKVKVEEEIVDDGNKTGLTGNGESKVTKKKTTTRSKKQTVASPLTTRTENSNLRVGAHVSTAGG
jgi:hypothetical protein